MTVADAQSEVVWALPSEDQSSLIAKFAASSKTMAAVPLPATVSVFRLVQTPAGSPPLQLLAPQARRACLLLRLALREKHKVIALTGSPKATLSAVIETAVANANYKRIGDWQASSWKHLVDELVSQLDEMQDLSSRQLLLVVEDVHSLPASTIQSLINLSDEQVRFSMQVLLAGQTEVWDKHATRQFRELASTIRARVALEPELGKEPQSKIEDRQYRESASRVRPRGALEPELRQEPQSKIEDDLARGWQSAEAMKRPPQETAERTQSVSPFPPLAELLGQSESSRSSRLGRAFALIAAGRPLSLFRYLTAGGKGAKRLPPRSWQGDI